MKEPRKDVNEVLNTIISQFKDSPIIEKDLELLTELWKKWAIEPYGWRGLRVWGKLNCDTDDADDLPRICLAAETDYVYKRYVPIGISLRVERFNYFTEEWNRLLECYIGLKETGEWVRGCGNTLGFESYVEFDERRFNLLTPRGRKVLEAVCGVAKDFLDLTENVKPHTPRCFPRIYDGRRTETD